MTDTPPSPAPRHAHTRLVVTLVAVVALMFGVAFASVPLYRLFCQVTGFGGTTQVNENGVATDADRVIDRWMTIRFNADTAPQLPWTFKPEQKEIRVQVGVTALAFFSAENTGDIPVTGTSVYNVTPQKAGQYFVKMECFCFERQTIAPGEKMHFPVSFFVDPSIADDDNLDDVGTITLSYTFFKAKEESE